MKDQIKKLRKDLHSVVDETKTLQIKMAEDETARTEENVKTFDNGVKAAQDLQAEIAKLITLQEAESFLKEPAKEAVGRTEPKTGEEGLILTPGQSFIESKQYKGKIEDGFDGGSSFSLRGKHDGFLRPQGVKATLTGNADLTGYERPSGIVLVEQRKPMIADLLAQGETSKQTIRYVQEDTFTNAATTVAEGGTKPEATFDISEVDAPVRKIAVRGRVSDETFDDHPFMRDYVDGRLVDMLKLTEDQQLYDGDGTGSNITGIVATSGIQTQAKGVDSNVDAIFKAITKVRATGNYEPTGIVINPTDWELIRLAKDSNNQYYGGGPFTGAYGNGGIAPDNLWGLPVVVSAVATAGTALVGAFRLGAQAWFRMGVTVEATNTNEDDFNKNLISIRVEERLALTVYRPKAFCTVTGIA